MEGQVTIIGLGCAGTSIGLALSQQGSGLKVVGHDRNPEYARQAQRMGAVSKTHSSLARACRGAGLVILALPLPAVRETLEVLGPDLEEGCVVTDTAPLKVPVLGWAEQHLPDHIRFVTGVPVPGPVAGLAEALVGPAAARADLFEGGLYCITPAHDTDPDAVTMLSGLAQLLGARVLFLDPTEYDGLRAGIADLPVVTAMAVVRATVDSPGWTDMRKVAGADFAGVTAPAVADSEALPVTVLLNRENLVRRLDMLLAELRNIRQWLQEGHEEAVMQAWTHAAQGRARWLEERAEGTWGEVPDVMEGVPRSRERALQLLMGKFPLRALRKQEDT